MISRGSFLDRFSWNPPEGIARLYACVSVASAMVLALWLLWHDVGLLSLLVPAVAFGLVIGRYRLFAALLPVLLCALLAQVSDVGPAFVTHPFGLSETFVCILGLALIVSSFRYSRLVSPSAKAEARFEFLRSSAKSLRGKDRVVVDQVPPLIEFLGLLLIVAGSHIVARLGFSLIDTEYLGAVVGFGLLPEGLLAIKLTLSVFIVMLIVHSVLSYVQWWGMGRTEATMRLQQQIWQWSGHEQRLVARVQERIHKD